MHYRYPDCSSEGDEKVDVVAAEAADIGLSMKTVVNLSTIRRAGTFFVLSLRVRTPDLKK